jgi:uridine phosphorylase
VLGPDGSIYHLALHPEEVAPIVLTVGDPDRVAKVSAHFDRITVRRQKREFVTHTGEIGGKRLTVISTGIGPDNIDIVINELDALFNIDLHTRTLRPEPQKLHLVRLGTSGSMQPDLEPGTFLASSFGAGLDNLLAFYRPTFTEEEREIAAAFVRELPELPAPYVVAGSRALLDVFSDWHQGITATCPGFYGPQGRSLRAGAALPDLPERLGRVRSGAQRVTNFEMETSAIYGMCRLLGHEALSLSVILANRRLGTFAENPSALEAELIRAALERVLTIA